MKSDRFRRCLRRLVVVEIALVLGCVGSVSAQAAGTPMTYTGKSSAAARSGREIYSLECDQCHAMGLIGAPRIGDKVAWAPRIAQGNAVLVQHVLHGYKAMPTKGNCISCTEVEIAAAVGYLVVAAK